MSSISNLGDLAENHLDFNSVKNVIGDSKQAMVYGWADCHYKKVAKALEKSPESCVKKVFDYHLGDSSAPKNEKTLEGREIEKLKVYIKPGKEMHRLCKTGVTNLLLENYKRSKEGKDIIPVIFCLDADDNQNVSSSETISSKDPKINEYVTNSELRRCKKLYDELNKSPDEELREMAEIAKQMLKFVKVVRSGENGDKAALQPIPGLWDLPDLTETMQNRTKVKPKWKEELEEAVEGEASAKIKHELLQKISEESREKLTTHPSKITKRNVKQSLEADQDAYEILQKKQAEVQNLKASVKGSKYHSGEWRGQLLRAAKQFEFDNI